MQIIKPLLGLSASPLGVIKFDTPNRFLLRKESNFQLGLKNCIQPLGAKSSLVNYSKFLLPRRDKPVHDENTWNIDWDFDALTEFSTPVLENQVETNNLLSQEEQAPKSDNNFIENFTTIITDSLPGTTLIDNSTNSSTEDDYHNLTSISNINQEAILNKKSNNSSKKSQTKKSTAKTNKSSKNTNPKKTKTTVNTAPETNQLKLNDNLTDHDVLKTSPPKGEKGRLTPPSLLGNSAGGLGFPNNVESQNDNNFQLASLVEQNQLEAKNLLQDEHIAISPQVIVHEIEHKSHVNDDIDSDININLKQISNQESILHPEVNTNFYDVEEIEASQETKNITKLNVPEKLVITQSVPKITLKPLEDNSAFDNLDNSQDSISQNISEVIKQPIQEREEIKQQHTEQSSITSQPISIYREISSVEPTEIINTVDTSEHTENLIHNISVEQNINLDFPITKTVINNDVIDNITENPAPVIDDNTQANSYTQSDLNTSSLASPLIKERQEFNDSQRQDEVITTNVTLYNINTQENNFEGSQTISPVQNTDLKIQKFSQYNLEENYHAPANYSKNQNIDNISTNLLNSLELISTDSNKELVPGANLDISDTTVIQKSIQHYNAEQTTDEIKSNLQLNNFPSVPTQNINNTVINSDIVNENNEKLVTHEKISNEQILPEISTSFVDNLETETLTNITDSKNILPILPESSSENLSDDLSSNLFNNLQNKLQAPTGYATGGLVAHSNTSDNPTIAPSDTVPAMLTPGEFVINVKDAQKNIDILRHINSGGTLPEDITTPVTSSIERTEESGATEKLNSVQPSTNVDIQTNLTNVISPKLTGSEIRSLGINTPNPIQLNTFDNSAENSNQNLTTGVTTNSRQYSSPPLIFRQASTSNTTKVNEHYTSTYIPSEWGSVEELLNASANSTNNSSSDNLEEFIFSKSAPSISTKRLPAVQGFAKGGEVTASDIATDIEPVTETIQRPADSNVSDSSKEENENNSSDLETLAHQIYSKLRQRLEIERERYGAYSGRLPW